MRVIVSQTVISSWQRPTQVDFILWTTGGQLVGHVRLEESANTGVVFWTHYGKENVRLHNLESSAGESHSDAFLNNAPRTTVNSLTKCLKALCEMDMEIVFENAIISGRQLATVIQARDSEIHHKLKHSLIR